MSEQSTAISSAKGGDIIGNATAPGTDKTIWMLIAGVVIVAVVGLVFLFKRKGN